MSFDFNSFDSSGNAFRDSGFNARGRSVPFTVRFWFQFGTTANCVFVSGPGWTAETSGGLVFIGDIFPRLLPAAGWNHFAGGFDGDRFFGQLNAGGRTFSPAPAASAPFGPGFNIVLQWFFLGFGGGPTPRLDEVALWKGRALNESDVTADYAAGAGLGFAGVDRGGLLAYWELEGTDGTNAGTLTDSLNGYQLLRVDTGVPSTIVYDAGKIGEGLFNSGGSSSFFDGTQFKSTDAAFSFGDA